MGTEYVSYYASAMVPVCDKLSIKNWIIIIYQVRNTLASNDKLYILSYILIYYNYSSEWSMEWLMDDDQSQPKSILVLLGNSNDKLL